MTIMGTSCAEEVHLIRFHGNNEVLFSVDPLQNRQMGKISSQHFTELPEQSRLAVDAHVRVLYVGVGKAQWVEGVPQSLPPVTEKEARFRLLTNGPVYDSLTSKILVLTCQGTIRAFLFHAVLQRFVILNREVTEYFRGKDGEVVGAFFSGGDERG